MVNPVLVNTVGVPQTELSDFCLCCGATATNKVKENTSFTNTGKGIRVFAGKHSEEYKDEVKQLVHVKTSAGYITILLKHKND